MISATTALICTIAAGILSCVVSLFKLIDRKRQRKVPLPTLRRTAQPATAATSLAAIAAGQEIDAAERAAPLMAGKSRERAAKLSDVAPLMQPGDPGLFSGRSIFAFIVRILGYTDKSHAWMVDRDDDGKLWIVDTCAGCGMNRRPLADEVAKYPGQLYWSRIAWPYRQHYKRELAVAAARALVGQKYGWLAIAFQVVIHTPFIRTLAYATTLDRCLKASLRFCSGVLKDNMSIGELDPVPGRAAALCTPQDIAQSLVAEEWIALLPG